MCLPVKVNFYALADYGSVDRYSRLIPAQKVSKTHSNAQITAITVKDYHGSGWFCWAYCNQVVSEEQGGGLHGSLGAIITYNWVISEARGNK